MFRATPTFIAFLLLALGGLSDRPRPPASGGYGTFPISASSGRPTIRLASAHGRPSRRRMARVMPVRCERGALPRAMRRIPGEVNNLANDRAKNAEALTLMNGKLEAV